MSEVVRVDLAGQALTVLQPTQLARVAMPEVAASVAVVGGVAPADLARIASLEAQLGALAARVAALEAP